MNAAEHPRAVQFCGGSDLSIYQVVVIMTFVVEKMSKEDIDRYGLRSINEQFKSGDSGYEWAVDREKDAYLRYMGMNWQAPEETIFSFYWRGTLMRIDLIKDATQSADGTVIVKWLVRSHKSPGTLPLLAELETARDELVRDLKDALTAYVEAGAESRSYKKIADFEF